MLKNPGLERIGDFFGVKPSPLTKSVLILLAAAFCAVGGCRDSGVKLPAELPEQLTKEDFFETGQKADCWPGWRGWHSAGIAPAGNPPIHFSAWKGYRWKTPLPGAGNSSPVVWEDRVFLTAADESEDPPRLLVLCLSRSTGRLVWSQEAGKAVGPTHRKNGYASATPATDGTRLIAFFGKTGLFAYDFAGHLLWHQELGDLHHQWGLASSPVICGDRVIQICESEGDSYLAAFDLQTGKRLWATPRTTSGCWSTPVVFPSDRSGNGKRRIIVVNGGKPASGTTGCVSGYDLENGRLLWEIPGTTELVAPTPLVSESLVICASGRNGPVLVLRMPGTLTPHPPEVLWRRDRAGPYIPTGLLYRGLLFLLRDGGELACFVPETGEVLWQAKLEGPFTASLIAANGRIYAANERGRIFVFDAQPQFRLLGRNDLGERILATPAVADGELIVRTEKHLFCFPGESSHGISTELAESSLPSPSGANGTTHLGFASGRVSQGFKNDEDASDASGDSGGRRHSAETVDLGHSEDQGSLPETGPRVQTKAVTSNRTDSARAASPSISLAKVPEVAVAEDSWPLIRGNPQATGLARTSLPEKLALRWRVAIDQGGFESTAAIVGGMVYAASSAGKVLALDLASGKIRWEFDTQSGFSSSPSVDNRFVCLGDVEGKFYCLDREKGVLVWEFATDGPIDSSANFADGRVIFGSQDSYLYCLDLGNGNLVWKYGSGDQIRCFPAIASNRCFVAGCDGQLHLVDLTDGSCREKIPLEGPTGNAAAIWENSVFIGTESGAFWALDWAKGEVLWRAGNERQPLSIRTSAAVDNELVIFGARDRHVRAYQRLTGKALWIFEARRKVDSSPVIVGDRVVFGSDDGRLYAVSRQTGELLWEQELGGPIVASPAVAEGCLVIGTTTGELFCLSAP